MSADFRGRMKEVLTLPVTSVIPLADGGTVTVIAMCTARLTLTRHDVYFLRFTTTKARSCLGNCHVGVNFSVFTKSAMTS